MSERVEVSAAPHFRTRWKEFDCDCFSYFCCLTSLPRRTVDYASNFGGELLAPVGLAEKLDPGVEASIMDDSVLGIPGSKQDLQCRNDLDGPLGELPTTYRSRHNDIGEQKIDLDALFQDGESLSAALCHKNGVTEIFLHRSHRGSGVQASAHLEALSGNS